MTNECKLVQVMPFYIFSGRVLLLSLAAVTLYLWLSVHGSCGAAVTNRCRLLVRDKDRGCEKGGDDIVVVKDR